METATSAAPADMFMERINKDSKKAQRLSDEGIVIQSAREDEVIADYWRNDEETVRQTLEEIAGTSGTQVRFTLQARG